MNGASLFTLGLDATEEQLYRHFLRNPHTLCDDVHLLLHVPRDTVREAHGRLAELGLLRRTEVTGTLSAADPEEAVERLTHLRLHDLHEQLQLVTRSRALVAELRAEQDVRSRPPQSVERMEVLSQIRTRIDDLAFFAREEILSVEPYAALTAENIEHSRPLDTRCLVRGVRIRSVILKESLTHPPTAAYLRELADQGAEIRVADSLSERILVYDRRTALVPVDPADTSRGALVTQQAGLVSNALALFEKIWSDATELPPSGEPDTAPQHLLSELEQRVLEQMCRVGKDETGARNLDISVRTYRRHIAELLRVLNATCRAHAALLARERGWI
ncbi:helix-turn-helix transcriptional regulator [Streptomyces sp. NPDC004111]|uniref:helix-turn-helix transcriptional regulator n=1 Tax=Streptomyces sp. NPDC004111 TaxID=3364690 RepID=UPI0036C5A964